VNPPEPSQEHILCFVFWGFEVVTAVYLSTSTCLRTIMVVGLPPRPRPLFRTRCLSSSGSSENARSREQQEAVPAPSDRHHGGHRESEEVTTGGSSSSNNNKYLHLVIPSDIVPGLANDEGRDDCPDGEDEVCSMARSGHTLDRFLEDVADAAEYDEDVESGRDEEEKDVGHIKEDEAGVIEVENSNEKSDSKEREGDNPDSHMYHHGEFDEDASVYRDEQFYMQGDDDHDDDVADGEAKVEQRDTGHHRDEQLLQNTSATTQNEFRAAAFDQSISAKHQYRIDQSEAQHQVNVESRPRRILYLSDSESSEEEDVTAIVPSTPAAQNSYYGEEEVREEAYDEGADGGDSNEEEEEESILLGEIIDVEGYSYEQEQEQEHLQNFESHIDGNELHRESGEPATEQENGEKREEEFTGYYDSHSNAVPPAREPPPRRTGGIPPRPPTTTATGPTKPRRQQPQPEQTKSESRTMESATETNLSTADKYPATTIRSGSAVRSMDGSIAASDAGSILEDLLGSELDHQASQSNESGIGDDSSYKVEDPYKGSAQRAEDAQITRTRTEQQREAASDHLGSKGKSSDELEYCNDTRADESEYDDVLRSYQVMRERQRARDLELQNATKTRHELLRTAGFERSNYAEPAYDPRDAYRASHCLGDEVSEVTDLTSLSPWVTNRRMDDYTHSRDIDNNDDSGSMPNDSTIGGPLGQIREEADENFCDDHDSTGALGPLVGKTLTLVPSPRSQNRREHFFEAQKAEKTRLKDRTGSRRRWLFGKRKKSEKVKASLKAAKGIQERHVDLRDHGESEIYYGKHVNKGGYQHQDTYTDTSGVAESEGRNAADVQHDCHPAKMQRESTYGYPEEDVYESQKECASEYDNFEEGFGPYIMHSNTEEEALHEAVDHAAIQLIQNDQQRRVDEQDVLRRKMEERAIEEEQILKRQEAAILAAINSGNEDELLAVLSSANINVDEPDDHNKIGDAAEDDSQREESGKFSLPTPSPLLNRFACGHLCASGSPLQPERIANVLREAFTNDDNDDLAYDDSRYVYQ